MVCVKGCFWGDSHRAVVLRMSGSVLSWRFSFRSFPFHCLLFRLSLLWFRFLPQIPKCSSYLPFVSLCPFSSSPSANSILSLYWCNVNLIQIKSKIHTHAHTHCLLGLSRLPILISAFFLPSPLPILYAILVILHFQLSTCQTILVQNPIYTVLIGIPRHFKQTIWVQIST